MEYKTCLRAFLLGVLSLYVYVKAATESVNA